MNSAIVSVKSNVQFWWKKKKDSAQLSLHSCEVSTAKFIRRMLKTM